VWRVIYVAPEPTDQGSNGFDLEPILFTPTILSAARSIYQAYVETHGDQQRPYGVAIDRYTFRGQLIFSEQPVLLPHECFVPLERLGLPDEESSATDLDLDLDL
jgi:hypothetical protein